MKKMIMLSFVSLLSTIPAHGMWRKANTRLGQQWMRKAPQAQPSWMKGLRRKTVAPRNLNRRTGLGQPHSPRLAALLFGAGATGVGLGAGSTKLKQYQDQETQGLNNYIEALKAKQLADQNLNEQDQETQGLNNYIEALKAKQLADQNLNEQGMTIMDAYVDKAFLTPEQKEIAEQALSARRQLTQLEKNMRVGTRQALDKLENYNQALKEFETGGSYFNNVDNAAQEAQDAFSKFPNLRELITPVNPMPFEQKPGWLDTARNWLPFGQTKDQNF